MIKTITQYRPGIYAEIARREAERQEREERNLRRIDIAADCILAAIVLGCLAWATWFSTACFTFNP